MGTNAEGIGARIIAQGEDEEVMYQREGIGSAELESSGGTKQVRLCSRMREVAVESSGCAVEGGKRNGSGQQHHNRGREAAVET